VLPMGHCASVGLTGLMLVGGQGVLSRHLGLASDYVGAIELVDHQGRIVVATSSNDFSDYLWLARGGGSGVQHFPGIITAVTLDNLVQRSVPSRKHVYTAFQINYEATVDNAEKLLLAWQDFNLDPEHTQDPLFSRLTVEPWMRLDRVRFRKQYQKVLYIACYFYGDNDLNAQFTSTYVPKLMNLMEGGRMEKIQRFNGLEFHRKLAGVHNNSQLADGKHGHDLKEEGDRMFNHWKSYSAVATERATGAAFRSLAKGIFEGRPRSRRYMELKPLGGAIRNLSKKETAFWHRDAIWWSLSSHFYHSTDEPTRVDQIVKSSRTCYDDYVRELGSAFAGHYAGYIDHGN
jgi:hypothetical protein